MDLLRSLGVQQHHLLTLLHYTNMVTTFVQTAFKQTLKTTFYVVDSFKPETYCFFQNQFIAVRTSDYNLESVTSPRVHYYFEKESGFYRGGPEYSTSRLNILSARLYHHNLQVADLSEFFYTTTYEAAEGIPQLGYWIAAWQLKNKIYLDVSKQFTLHFTTVLGERYSIDYEPLHTECQQAWSRLNNDVRHMNQRNVDDTDESDSEYSSDGQDQGQGQEQGQVTSVPQTNPVEPAQVDASTQSDIPAVTDTVSNSTEVASEAQ